MDNQNTQNSSGMMNGMPQRPREAKKVGPLFAIVIIVLVLVVAALYFFSQRLNTAPVVDNLESTPAESSTAAAVESDDIDNLQSELNDQLKNVDYSF